VVAVHVGAAHAPFQRHCASPARQDVLVVVFVNAGHVPVCEHAPVHRHCASPTPAVVVWHCVCVSAGVPAGQVGT
jgi:hypothetical protein